MNIDAKKIIKEVVQRAERERNSFLEQAQGARKRGNWKLADEYERRAAKKSEVIRKSRLY